MTEIQTINLIEPADGMRTAELQAFQWDGNYEPSPHDRSRPVSINFCWEAGVTGVVYDLKLTRDDAPDRPLIKAFLLDARCSVTNLHAGARYSWQVTAREGDTINAQSPIWSFVTDPTPPRWIHVQGVTNVRDLGGWPLPHNARIRQGLVYRGAEMNDHHQISPEGRRVLEDELGVRTDIDLRGEDEDARAVLDIEKVKWVNFAIYPYASLVRDEYTDMYRDIFRIFADPDAYPIFFHCWGGCDRGGTVAFLLSALLGSSMENLGTDYELSSLSIWDDYSRDFDRFQSLIEALKGYGKEGDDMMRRVECYLLDIGVTEEEIASIRSILIE